MTAYGRRKQRDEGEGANRERGGDTDRTPQWMKVFAFLILGLMLLFVIVHLAGGGLGALHHR